MSNIDVSGIDETNPVQGQPTTASVRDNFAAIKSQLSTAKTELEDVALQRLQSPAEIRPDSLYRAWQGVASDGEYIYVTSDRDASFSLSNTISVYKLDGTLVTEKTSAYTGLDASGRFMSFGDCSVIDGNLYTTAYNINGGAPPAEYESRILIYSLPDLVLQSTIAIGGNIAEGIDKYNNEFWVCYFDIETVKRYDINWNLINSYAVAGASTVHGGGNSLKWINGELYLNLHGANAYGSDDLREMRIYSWSGTAFTYSRSLIPPTYGATQGFDRIQSGGNTVWLFNDRPANSIIITPWPDGKPRRASLIHRVKFNKVITPTLLNGWVAYDTYRTARAWRDSMGYVHLEGTIKNGGGSPDVIFQLPAHWAPKYSLNFPIAANDAFGAVAVVGTQNLAGNPGEVHRRIGSNVWFSLDGVYWLSDPDVQAGDLY